MSLLKRRDRHSSSERQPYLDSSKVGLHPRMTSLLLQFVRPNDGIDAEWLADAIGCSVEEIATVVRNHNFNGGLISAHPYSRGNAYGFLDTSNPGLKYRLTSEGLMALDRLLSSSDGIRTVIGAIDAEEARRTAALA